MKDGSRIVKLAVTGFVIGILVSVFEFACTGQIYLPTILIMLRIPGMKFRAFRYLLLYNFLFILPLIIIFILAWKGVTSEQLGKVMMKNLGKTKILLALLFFGLGIFVLLY